MIKMKNQSVESTDYFDFLLENKLERLTCVAIATLVTIIMPVFLYSIIWYEKYCNDSKRTLLNRLVALNCRTGIHFLLLSHVPEILRYAFGPFSEKFCFIHLVGKSTLGWIFLLHVDAIAITRYIFIFWLKNPVAFHDNFWSQFISIWIHGFSFLAMFVWHFVAQFQTMAIYLCAGKDPSIMRQHFPKAYGVMETFSVIVHVFIQIKVVMHKRKNNQSQINNVVNNDVQSNKTSLFKYAINIFTLLFLSTVILAVKKTESMSMKDLSIYPNFIGLFYINLLASSLLGCVIAVSFLKDNNFRTAITKEVLREFQLLF
jgi:hypothetical protein